MQSRSAFLRVRTQAVAALTAGILAVSLFVAVPARATEAQTQAPAEGSQETAPGRPDAMSASVTARESGEAVEVLAARGEATSTYANPDGTFTTRRHAGPVRVFDSQDQSQGESGSWRDIDTDLVDAGVEIEPQATKAQLAFSDGGGGDAARLDVGRRSLAFGWPSTLPAPSLDGPVATYRDVRPGVDLQFEALASGFSQRIVVHEGPAEPLSFTLPLELEGLSIEADVDGTLRLARADGEVLVTSPPSLMWDARTTDLDGDDPSHFAPVSTTVVESADGPVLQVVPDESFLADEATQYPVVIDPTPYTTTADTHVRSDTLDTSYSTEGFVRLGARDAGAYKLRSLLKFPLGDLTGKEIVSAKLNLYEVSSGSCTKRDFQVRRVQEEFNLAQATWRNQPPVGSTIFSTVSAAQGYSSSCPNAWIEANVKTLVQYFADGAANYGIRLHASDETDVTAYKSFESEQNGRPPYIEVTYNSYPSTVSTTSLSPAGGTFVNTLTPELKGNFHDPDHANGKVVYEVAKDDATSTPVYTRSLSSDSFVASGRPSPWTVPSAAGLQNGVRYKWRARSYDGRVYSKIYTAWRTFTVDTVSPAAPVITSTSHPDQQQCYNTTVLQAAWTASTDANLLGYNIAFSQSATTVPTTFQVARTATITVPADSGLWYLHVQAKDKAGNLSPTANPYQPYKFYVGEGAVTSPTSGEQTFKRQVLRAQGPSLLTNVTFEWRQPNGVWSIIPANTVLNNSNLPIGQWPVQKDGLESPPLTWDVSATPSLEDYSGPLEVRARFNGGAVSTPPTDFLLDQHALAGDYGHADMGPGRLNLVTGNFAMSAEDVGIVSGESALSVTRMYNSRNPSVAADGPFGPGWQVGTPDAATGTSYDELLFVRAEGTTNTSHAVVTTGDGSYRYFTAVADTSSPGGTAYIPDAPGHSLEAQADGSFTLTDADGVAIRFEQEGATHRPKTLTVASGPGASYIYEASGTRRLLRLVHDHDATSSCAGAVDSLGRGCRVLTFHYGLFNTTAGPVDRLQEVRFSAWEGSVGEARTVPVARYSYDSEGRLASVWDPQTELINSGAPIKVTYEYDNAGLLSAVTPPGEQPWELHYSDGRIQKVTRDSTAHGTITTNAIYDVPLAGVGAPHDLGPADVAAWGQEDAPTDATALFPPTNAPITGAPTAAELRQADITYFGKDGLAVNVAAGGRGITTTQYDKYGNVIRELSARNRETALSSPTPDITASRLDTRRLYSTNGHYLLEELGPEHEVALSSGETLRARQKMVHTYNEGAPTGVELPLPTTTQVGALTTDGSFTDVRVTTTQYDWERRLQTGTIVDPSGTHIHRRTLYNESRQEAERRQPSDPNGGGPGSSRTLYYAAADSADADCANHPEWSGLVCKKLPAQQVAGGGLPGLPTQHILYDRWHHATVVSENVPQDVGSPIVRMTEYKFDAAGRLEEISVSGGAGAAIGVSTFAYDSATGRPTSVSRDGLTVVRSYDEFGRVERVRDSGGNTAEIEYDAAGRQSAVTDGRGSQTIAYVDGDNGAANSVDSDAGSFGTTYDSEGNATEQRLPGGVVAHREYNEVGEVIDLVYERQNCTSECVIASFQAKRSAAGQMIEETSPSGTASFSYDGAGRLEETVTRPQDGSCVLRTYGWDSNTNRTSRASYGPDSDGGCSDALPTESTSYSYDAGDRLTGPGVGYDALARVTSLPAELAGGSPLTVGYYTDDRVKTLTQDGVTYSFTADPMGRVAARAAGSQVTTYGYAGEGDEPAWMQTGGDVVRYISSAEGALMATFSLTGAGASTLELPIVDLRGSVVGWYTPNTSSLELLPQTDEFGSSLEEEVDSAQARYSWQGSTQRERLFASGVTLMGARLYVPSLGRFLQRDSVEGGCANAYTYVHGDPINDADPSGRASFMCNAGSSGFRTQTGWASTQSSGSRAYFGHILSHQQRQVFGPLVHITVFTYVNNVYVSSGFQFKPYYSSSYHLHGSIGWLQMPFARDRQLRPGDLFQVVIVYRSALKSWVTPGIQYIGCRV